MNTEPFNLATILTFTGKMFHLLSPSDDEICIEDIAHHLSMLCRFTGACRKFYSVAEHSVKASLIVPAEFAMEALFHDGSESYLNDMNRPLKHYTEAGQQYMILESVIQKTINTKFGVPLEMSPAVKDADNAMLYAEKAAIMPLSSWVTKWSPTEEAADIEISCWEPAVAEQKFLERFYQLNAIRNT